MAEPIATIVCPLCDNAIEKTSSEAECLFSHFEGDHPLAAAVSGAIADELAFDWNRDERIYHQHGQVTSLRHELDEATALGEQLAKEGHRDAPRPIVIVRDIDPEVFEYASAHLVSVHEVIWQALKVYLQTEYADEILDAAVRDISSLTTALADLRRRLKVP
jgi:hypothetical protein